jgi:hypothetical protein
MGCASNWLQRRHGEGREPGGGGGWGLSHLSQPRGRHEQGSKKDGGRDFEAGTIYNILRPLFDTGIIAIKLFTNSSSFTFNRN